MELESNTNIIIPENAHFIEEEKWIDMSNQLNWLIVGIPIFMVILGIMLLKQRKNGILNKSIRKEYIENNKMIDNRKKVIMALKGFFLIILIFSAVSVLIIPIHEILHCIAGALVGLNMKFGIDPQSFLAFAYTDDALTKIQFLVMSLTPLVILVIIPLIIIFAKYPKERVNYTKGLKYWILTCFIGTIILTCCPDIIQSFNFIKNIPNGAIVEENYWYIPNK